jgi:tetratricopeptide (TPR) repeat protein
VTPFPSLRYQEALGLFQPALEIRARALGRDNPATAIIHSNLGLLFMRVGEFKEADTHLQQCLQIRTKQLGEKHSEVAEVLYNLGQVGKTRLFGPRPQISCSIGRHI